MKKSNFWFLTLCVFLMIAGVNGWSTWLRIAVAANAIVVLMDVVQSVRTMLKKSEGELNG